MILRDRPSAWGLFFVWRGSIVPKILPRVLATMGLALAVALAHGRLLQHDLTLTAAPFTMVGLALSIFLGFRNTVAYDRFWEGRRLWGDLVIAARTWARQVGSLVADAPGDAAKTASVRRAIAFAHALRHHLRDTEAGPDLAPLLSTDDHAAVLAASHRPAALARLFGRDLGTWLRDGRLAEPVVPALDRTAGEFDRILASCERIRTTPIPFSYSLLLHRTAYLYCFLLPFGLVDTVGLATPLVVGLVSYTFFGLDALGDEIEEPFGTDPNDLPLSALCRTIEINLREALGEADLPAPAEPVGYVLS